MRKIVEPLPEPLQKEVSTLSLKWLNAKEDITKKQQMLKKQINNLNGKDNEDCPRSATIDFEIRVSPAAKEMHKKK